MLDKILYHEAMEKLSDENYIAEAKKVFDEKGVIHIEDFINENIWKDIVLDVYNELSELMVDKNVMEHKVDMFESEKRETLTNGFSFRRANPASYVFGENSADANTVYREKGIYYFGGKLGAFVKPFLEKITGANLSLDSTKFFIYEEGDYIGIHNDLHNQDHVNFQLPLSINTVGSFRYLDDGLMKLCYDTPGNARVLAARVWHDVPPLLRLSQDKDPLRFLFIVRFNYD